MIVMTLETDTKEFTDEELWAFFDKRRNPNDDEFWVGNLDTNDPSILKGVESYLERIERNATNIFEKFRKGPGVPTEAYIKQILSDEYGIAKAFRLEHGRNPNPGEPGGDWLREQQDSYSPARW